MNECRRPLVLIAFGLLGAAVLSGPAAPAAPAPGDLVYEGSFANSELTWDHGADGTVTPRLSGARPWSETARPALASSRLHLLVPAQSGPGQLQIVPLSTRRVSLPGPLALGSARVSDEGVAVVEQRLPLDGEYYPSVWGEMGGRQVYRGYHVAGLVIYPLRAVRGTEGEWQALEILERFAVRWVPQPGAAPALDLAVRERWVPGERERCEAAIAPLVANPEALAGYSRDDGDVVPVPAGGFSPSRVPSLSGSAVSFVIVTTAALETEFQRLADHKTANGLPSVVKTTEWITANYRQGADLQETIRMFLREAYSRWGVEYVLLGGDTDVLPARYVISNYYPPGSSTKIPVDLYFGGLDGNWNADGDQYFGEPYFSFLAPGDDADLADEIRVGRAPVSSLADAASFVDKVIGYEGKGTSAAYLNRALFAAEVLFPSAWSQGLPITLDGATFTESIINNYLVPCTNMGYTRMYENYLGFPGAVPLTRAALIDTLNHGRHGIFNQVGHGFYYNMSVGDANFLVVDADNLNNGQNTFLLYALNCASAAFDYACLLERFIQNNHGGSVVSIGASRAAFPYTANDYQAVFFDELYCGDVKRVGDLMTLSRLPMLAETSTNTVDRWTFMCYALLGDPSVAIWTGAPKTSVVSAPPSLGAGAQVVNVSVTSGGSPVGGALVCLSKGGDDYATGTTNAAGQVALSFTPTSTGSATLKVSGAGLAASSRTIPVTTSGAYIKLDGVTLVDNGSGGTSGNGDGRPDAGEIFAVWAQYRDTGAGGALNCSGTLSGSVPGVTIIDGTAAIGNVPSGGVKAATEPFLVQLAADVADGTHLPFTVVVSAQGGGSYASEWTPVALAPELEPISLNWSDLPYGDGDGVRENGERLTITVTLKNYGAGLSMPLTARLRTADPQVTLFDTVSTYPAVGLLASAGNLTPLSFSAVDVTATPWCWILFTDGAGRSFRHDFHLDPLAAPVDLTTDSSLGPTVITLAWSPVSGAGLRGYQVYRSTLPNGPFTRANADLVDGVSYFRTDGLASLTQYYFRIATVDSSLVEGPMSLTISASTNPPEQSGFPLAFKKETSGHSAVGDVNGDGVLEVVIGSDKICVWNALGQELLDGDNDPQSHGPISPITATNGWGPSGVALADLDGQLGLEIVAQLRDTKQVYVMRWNGTVLPGWPRTLVSGWSWATPAIGDIDGDGQPEIVVNALDGRTYAWNVDGTEVRDGDNNPATNGVLIYRTEAANEWTVATPALFDIDGNGAKEIIFPSKLLGLQNYLYAYRYTGTQVPGFPVAINGRVACSPGVADVNNDGVFEIAFVSENDLLYLIQENGTPYPGYPVSMVANDLQTGSPSCPSPAFGDLDADGSLDVIVVSTIAVLNASLRAYSTNQGAGTSGQILAGWPRSLPANSEGSPVVGDIDGDGFLEIVHPVGADNENSQHGIFAFNADGSPVSGFPIYLTAPARACPVITDFDLDGDVDIIQGGWDLQLHVWDMPGDYDRAKVPWGTFHGHNSRDGVYRPVQLTDVPPPAEELAAARLLLPPNHPNPFNPATSIRVYLPGEAGSQPRLEVAIYDLQGRRIRELHAGPTTPGWHTLRWDGCDGAGRRQASGLYCVRARGPEQAVTRKIMLVQ